MLSGASSSGSALQRSKSLPRLPSHPREAAEVKPVRKPISRPYPDKARSQDFQEAGGKSERAKAKFAFQKKIQESCSTWIWLLTIIKGNAEFRQLLESAHPRIHLYNSEQKRNAFFALVHSHPKLLAEMAKSRNQLYAVPNYATSSRLMKPKEQKFLTQAMQAIRKDVEKKPFHRHGESGAVGNQNGELTWFGHHPGGAINMKVRPGDKYALHNHLPLEAPLSSSASEMDHQGAAESYLEFNKMKEYVTNGKDVLRIPPDSMELVRLLPDPKVEQDLGKFPVAFTLPHPQMPPRPFLNHEAPASFKKGWAPPPGWMPPPDYPRAEPVWDNRERSMRPEKRARTSGTSGD
jgi:hypothetical protein